MAKSSRLAVGPVVGIDPGLTGALGWKGENGCGVEDLPIIRVHSKGYINSPQLRQRLLDLKPSLIVIELQGVRPKQGITSAGQTMLVYGGIVATALTLGVPVELVAASKWKRALGLLGAGKELSRYKALKKFPSLAKQLKRKKDHNRAEGLLLASWGTTVH